MKIIRTFEEKQGHKDTWAILFTTYQISSVVNADSFTYFGKRCSISGLNQFLPGFRLHFEKVKYIRVVRTIVRYCVRVTVKNDVWMRLIIGSGSSVKVNIYNPKVFVDPFFLLFFFFFFLFSFSFFSFSFFFLFFSFLFSLFLFFSFSSFLFLLSSPVLEHCRIFHTNELCYSQQVLEYRGAMPDRQHLTHPAIGRS